MKRIRCNHRVYGGTQFPFYFAIRSRFENGHFSVVMAKHYQIVSVVRKQYNWIEMNIIDENTNVLTDIHQK